MTIAAVLKNGTIVLAPSGNDWRIDAVAFVLPCARLLLDRQRSRVVGPKRPVGLAIRLRRHLAARGVGNADDAHLRCRRRIRNERSDDAPLFVDDRVLCAECDEHRRRGGLEDWFHKGSPRTVHRKGYAAADVFGSARTPSTMRRRKTEYSRSDSRRATRDPARSTAGSLGRHRRSPCWRSAG